MMRTSCNGVRATRILDRLESPGKLTQLVDPLRQIVPFAPFRADLPAPEPQTSGLLLLKLLVIHQLYRLRDEQLDRIG